MEATAQPAIAPRRTENKTKIHYYPMAREGHRKDGSEPLYEFYKRLNLLNTGRWNGKWRNEQYERMIDRLNILDAIASQLDLTPSQKGWAKSRFKKIDLRPYTRIGGIYIVAFCLCAIACSRDGRQYHPSRSVDNNDPEFVRVAESIGFPRKNLHKAYGKVRATIAS